MKTQIYYIAALFVSLALCSCQEIEEPLVEESQTNETSKPKVDSKQNNSDLKLGQEESKALVYAPLTELQRAVADKEAEFSFNLCKAVSKSGADNISISPFSVFTNLSMLAAGTTGETFAEITSAMDLKGYSKEAVAEYCKAITDDLKILDNNTILPVFKQVPFFS